MEQITEILHTIVAVSQLLLELMGIVVIVVGGIQSMLGFLRGEKHLRFVMAERISLALEFLMAGEILHTIVAEEYKELIILGAIIVFRAILTWENSHELKELEEAFEKHKDQIDEP